jgi:hypothetical protein
MCVQYDMTKVWLCIYDRFALWRSTHWEITQCYTNGVLDRMLYVYDGVDIQIEIENKLYTEYKNKL